MNRQPHTYKLTDAEGRKVFITIWATETTEQRTKDFGTIIRHYQADVYIRIDDTKDKPTGGKS